MMAAMLAAPAWAVGERIILPETSAPFGDQIKDTLCVSMECISKVESKTKGLDATVSAKMVKAKKGANTIELTVTSASGAVKAVVKAPASDTGLISSMDLVAASSAVLAAIEGPEPTGKIAAKASGAVAAKAKKHSVLRLATKSHGSHNHG